MDVSKEEKKELVIAAKEASELADFETTYIPTTAPPVQWSIEKLKVAERLALSSMTRKQIAKELNLPKSVIDKWCENSEFMDFVNQLVMDSMKDMRAHRLKFLNKILAARMEQAEIEGYADASRKDTLDIITEIRKETGEDLSRDSNYSRFLEKLILNQPPQQIINIGGGE